jgi:hypothetical protein
MGLGTLLLALALALGAAGFAQHDIWYAAAVAAGSGYWDLSSQPATFPSQTIRQHQVATDDTSPCRTQSNTEIAS